jgi:RNA recognition motif-containing protein
MKLYIGNLSYSTTEEEIVELLSPFGTADSVQLIKDRHTGQSKGFGFVEMNDNSEADAAIKGLNDSNFKGRKIKLNQAQPREKSRNRRRY